MVDQTSSSKRRKWDQADTSSEPANKISKTETDANNKTIDPVKAASIAAAKINAMYSAKMSASTTDESTGSSTTYSGSVPQAPGINKVEFTKKIEINDLKNRYLLTRGPTQTEITQETGAEITTRGKYYPDVNLATEKEPPLYLFICADNQESLDKAIAKVNELIETSKVPTSGPPSHYGSSQNRRSHGQDHDGSTNDGHSNEHHHGEDRGHNGYSHRPPRKFHEEDVMVDIADGPNYNLRAKIVGPQGAYVKHISSVTGCRIQLRGKGSGFYEQETGVESEEPLHIHISTPRLDQLPKAVQLAKDLIGTIKEEVEKRNQQGSYHRSYHAPPPPSSSSPDYHYPQGYDYQRYGTEASNATSAAAPGDNYGNYDYSQYDYYGQQQYDPSYYNQYGQYYQQPAAAAAAEAQPIDSTSQHASPLPSQSPPHNESSSSYTSVPPPSNY